LTDGQVRKERLDDALAGKFIGGLGICVKLAGDLIKPGTSPYSPENPVVIGAGPFVGTNLPGSSRVFAVTKFPSSGTVGWCGGGGMTFGCQLKNSGYDHIVLEGRADRPVYLKITDGRVEICDAGPLWGKGVEETCRALWSEHGRPGGIISIGQAGENLVSFSLAFVDRVSTIGRGGLGAVMGSKRLKAIFVRGSQGVKVADEKSYRKLSGDLFRRIRNYPYLKEWQELGLIKSLPIVPRELYLQIRKRRISCVSCPIGDKEIIEMPDGAVKYSSSVFNLFVPTIFGMHDYRDSVRCITVLDDYGLDMFEFFGLLGYAGELRAQGIIREDRLKEDIKINDIDSMCAWAGKISRREGFGAVLADGYKGLFRELGREAEERAPGVVKGMSAYVGPRAPIVWNLFGTMELGQVLDPRGPHPAASGSPTYFAKRDLSQFPGQLARMGVPEETISRILPEPGAPEQDLKVGRLLNYSQNWFAVLGSLGLCGRAQINRFYSADLCAKLFSAVTGIRAGSEDLMKCAGRVWDLFRALNYREGFDRRDDKLPDNWFADPPFRNYLTEKPLSRREAEQMLEDYYDERGWDIDSGVPGRKKLEEMGLKV
jgi:aldehyde:ferredoxin oxidoreductase